MVETRKVKTILITKPRSIEYLIEETKLIYKEKNIEELVIVKEILLSSEEYNKFLNHLLGDYDYIKNNSYLCIKNRAIAIINKDTKEELIVNTEGSSYARYIGFEIK